MGRFDDPKEDADWKRTKKIMKLMLVVLVIAFIIFVFSRGGDRVEEVDSRCSEMFSMMFDDPDHERLHSTYPTIMKDLHKYIQSNCVEDPSTIFDEDTPQIDDSSSIEIGVGIK